MKWITIVTLVLLIVGGLNWGLVALFNFDLVAALFGAGSMGARVVYCAVAASALWQLNTVVSLSTTRDDRLMERRV